MAKQQRLQGLIVGSRHNQIEMVRAMETTGLKPVVDSTFTLDDVAGAFRHEESGAHFGKICIEI
jgi:NADPH:quinone reductase-like Zn-dependent oxidoreductase